MIVLRNTKHKNSFRPPLKRAKYGVLQRYWRKVPRPLPRTRTEFYQWVTPEVKAEWIAGRLVLQSPARARHLDSTLYIAHLLFSYFRVNNLPGKLSLEKALCVFPQHDFEPDICYWGPEKCVWIDDETLLHPIPDFIVEVLSKGTMRRDRGVKKDNYEANGVREYWIVDAKRKSVERYELNEAGRYVQAPFELVLAPSVFPGLRFPLSAVFSRRMNDLACNSLFLPTYAEELARARAETDAAYLRERQAVAEAEAARLEAEDARSESIRLKRELIHNLLAEGFSIENVARLTGLTSEGIAILLQEN